MGRPVKDYWNWQRLEFAKKPGDWLTPIRIEEFLKRKGSSNYAMFVKKEFPPEAPRGGMGVYKRITDYIFYIKDPKDFTMVALKYNI